MSRKDKKDKQQKEDALLMRRGVPHHGKFKAPPPPPQQPYQHKGGDSSRSFDNKAGSNPPVFNPNFGRNQGQNSGNRNTNFQSNRSQNFQPPKCWGCDEQGHKVWRCPNKDSNREEMKMCEVRDSKRVKREEDEFLSSDVALLTVALPCESADDSTVVALPCDSRYDETAEPNVSLRNDESENDHVDQNKTDVVDIDVDNVLETLDTLELCDDEHVSTNNENNRNDISESQEQRTICDDDDENSSIEYLSDDVALIVGGSEDKRSDKDDWFVDSAASSHFTFDETSLIDYVAFKEPSKVFLGDDTYVLALGKGKRRLGIMSDGEEKYLALDRVLFVPELAKNLLSVKGND